MNRFLLLIVGALAVGSLFGDDRAPDNKKELMKQMQKKLEYSKNIVSGLVAEDYETILKNATALNELGQKRWKETESKEYLTQNQIYWFTTNALVLAAKEKNIDGATLAYNQMTVSCVNCHKLLRQE